MEAKKRHIRDGREFDVLFPKPEGKTKIISKDASVDETMKLIPKVVNTTLSDTKKISKLLKGKHLRETCENVWNFVYQHIAYKRDKSGVEQVRRPSRTWFDRKGDCDCFTVFISSILKNLGISHKYRITKYEGRSFFQHIYPIVPALNGHIILDCVTDHFDYEVPFTFKQDTDMDLHYLNGIDEEMPENLSIDAEDLLMADDGLGKPRRGRVKGFFKKVGKGLKKGLHVVNRFNPATTLLRLGVVASMKLNIMKVASRMRFAYLSDSEAKRRGYNLARLKKLRAIKKKFEGIFHHAGGKTANLKKAILTGKGNRDGAVPLNGLGQLEFVGLGFTESSPLSEILGEDLYLDEAGNTEGLSGELGEPATGATIAAATGVLASVAGLLKQVGDVTEGGKKLFGKKKKKQRDSGSNNDLFLPTRNVQPVTVPAHLRNDFEESGALRTSPSSSGGSVISSGNDVPAPPPEEQGFLDKIKANPGKTALIGLGVIGAAVGGGILLKRSKAKKEAKAKHLQRSKSLSGTGKRKSSTRKTTAKPKRSTRAKTTRSKTSRSTPKKGKVALM